MGPKKADTKKNKRETKVVEKVKAKKVKETKSLSKCNKTPLISPNSGFPLSDAFQIMH